MLLKNLFIFSPFHFKTLFNIPLFFLLSRGKKEKKKIFFEGLTCKKNGATLKNTRKKKVRKTKMKNIIINLITLDILLLIQKSAVPSCG